MTSNSPNPAPPGNAGRAVIRIIARPVKWPDLRSKADRAGLRLRWDALTEDGVLLVSATEYRLAEGAHVLVTVHGASPDQPVTLRHEGAIFDSFAPVPIAIPAAQGARRAASRERLAKLRARHPEISPSAMVAGADSPKAVDRRISGVCSGMDGTV